MSDPAPLAQLSLPERLRERIRAHGPIRFEEFMEAALYDESGGFYSRGKRLGRHGAFSTAPTISPLFGAAVAAEARACWRRLGRPDPFVVVELGPGDGSLAAALAGELGDLPLDLVLVERAAGMRAIQERALEARARWTGGSPDGTHFLVANEVLDAISFALIEDGREVGVALDPSNAFIETHLMPHLGVLSLLPAQSKRGRYIARPSLDPVLRNLLKTVVGSLLILDYGGPTEAVHDGRDPVRTFIGGHPGGPAVQAPGTQDITADVDFTHLTKLLEKNGFDIDSDEPQERWLRRRLGSAGALPGAAGPEFELRPLMSGQWRFRSLCATRNKNVSESKSTNFSR